MLLRKTGLRNERGRTYQRILREADSIAKADGQEEKYLREVTEMYEEAADLLPGKEEAYLRILDYCARRGRTKAGLLTVCARIDAGSGGIDHCAAVLFKVAELYLGGNPVDADFSGDYRKAARYFALIDRREVPETVYFASLAEAMSSAGGRMGWEHIAEILRKIEMFNEGISSGINRVRNCMLAAEVYALNRRAFLDAGVDADSNAVRLLREALRELAGLRAGAGYREMVQTDPDDLWEKEQRIRERLAEAESEEGGGLR